MGVIIGAAFGGIVKALVDDIIMPLVSLILPSGDWRSAGIVLKEGLTPDKNVVLKYGDFLGTCLNFVIVGFALFPPRVAPAQDAQPAQRSRCEGVHVLPRGHPGQGEEVQGLHRGRSRQGVTAHGSEEGSLPGRGA